MYPKSDDEVFVSKYLKIGFSRASCGNVKKSVKKPAIYVTLVDESHVKINI